MIDLSAAAAGERTLFNVYCDESCHLELDHQPVMTLGALWLRHDRARAVADDLRDIKARHGLPRTFETKWVKVSEGKRAFYEALADYYLESSDLRFRGLVATGKDRLDHAAWDRDHDTWYYVMFYELLKELGLPTRRLRVYLDYKDTQGAEKVRRLSEVLATKLRSTGGSIERIQTIRSDESEVLQLADLLIGAVSYANRNLGGMRIKTDLISRIESGTHRSLTRTTPLSAVKLNLLVWTPK